MDGAAAGGSLRLAVPHPGLGRDNAIFADLLRSRAGQIGYNRKMREFLKKLVIFVLTWEAKLILKKYKPKIVAITGSVGKTSTKDAVAKVLEAKFRVRKSQKSYNSELGVPLAIIGAQTGWNSVLRWLSAIWQGVGIIVRRTPYPEILVLEVGVDRPGDIKAIRSWLEPDVAVVTTLADVPVHIEFFKSPEELFAEKAELVKNLSPEKFVLLNFDDLEVMKMKDKTQAKIITFGFSEGSEFWGYEYELMFREGTPEGIKFKVKNQNQEVPVKILNAFGRHQVYPALAAIAAGKIFDIKLEDAAETLSLYSPPPGRLKLVKGIKDTLILDDSYNSSPKALQAALEVLGEIEAPRKIAVLGDMLELGKHTITAHRDLGRLAAARINLLVTVGVRAKFFSEGAAKAGFKKRDIKSFSNSDEAGEGLLKIIKPGDLILVKGSQGIRMEKIVEKIMAEPEKKSELLCRQEPEWQNR